uniref:Nuclear-export cofactor Arc1-like N-terminal domain-containing protein n=1 Tax=Ciona savignyi TaxID=51511 RepID=H2ZQW4_CIOSA
MLNSIMTSLEAYFGQSEGQSKLGPATQIISMSTGDFSGKYPKTRALVWQWLEDLTSIKSGDLDMLAKRLNIHLQNNVYIVDNSFTVVDVVLFYVLQQFVSELTQHERQQRFTNLSRWFDFIQHKERVLINQSFHLFVKNKIY